MARWIWLLSPLVCVCFSAGSSAQTSPWSQPDVMWEQVRKSKSAAATVKQAEPQILPSDEGGRDFRTVPPPVKPVSRSVLNLDEPFVAAPVAPLLDGPPPCAPPCVAVFGEYLFLKARGTDIPYGQPRDGVTELAVPRGPVGVATPDNAWGARAGIAWAVTKHSILEASYTYFKSDGGDRMTVEAPLAIRSLLVFPATLNTAADSLAATADIEVNFKFIDAAFKHTLWNGCRASLWYLVGARYANLDQELNATYSILGTTTVKGDIEFDGLGARVGLEGTYCLKHGFYTYSRGAVSLVAGRFRSKYEQRNFFSGLQASTAVDEERVVPILELEVGLGYSFCKDRVRISAGYSFTGWYNTLTLPSLVEGVRNSNFTTNTDNFRDTITFDGLVGRIEFRY